MFTGQVAVISNKATWLSDVCELEDLDGQIFDLANPLITVDIVVTISDMNRCVLVTASGGNHLGTPAGNGKVVIPGPGFQWRYERADLSGLCPGTYELGVKITVDGFVDDFVDGTITVVEGNP